MYIPHIYMTVYTCSIIPCLWNCNNSCLIDGNRHTLPLSAEGILIGLHVAVLPTLYCKTAAIYKINMPALEILVSLSGIWFHTARLKNGQQQQINHLLLYQYNHVSPSPLPLGSNLERSWAAANPTDFSWDCRSPAPLRIGEYDPFVSIICCSSTVIVNWECFTSQDLSQWQWRQLTDGSWEQKAISSISLFLLPHFSFSLGIQHAREGNKVCH